MAVTYSGKLTISGKLKSFIESVVSVLPDWSIATQQTRLQASNATADDYFGYSVSISEDGNTAIVGAYFDDNSGGANAGSAYVFTRSGGVWTEQTRLQASDAQASDLFGVSVALSSDGNTAIVGAYQEDQGGINAGSAYVFTRSGITWTQQQKLSTSNAQAGDFFGYSVALSSDGNTAIIGANSDDNSGGANAGSAYVFTRSGITWTEQTRLQASNAQANDNFGYSVSISGDGNTAIVGAYSDDNSGGTDAGSAYVFTRSGITWTEQTRLQASDTGSGDRFGYSVSISDDGNTAIVGAFTDNNSGGNDAGSAYVFTRSGFTWTEQTRLQASDAQANDNFGYSVSISDDGNTAIVSAHNEDTGGSDVGAAYIFTQSGSVWSEQAKIQASEKQDGDLFGNSVSISGDGNTAIIGAVYDNNSGGNDAGSAYVFVAG